MSADWLDSSADPEDWRNVQTHPPVDEIQAAGVNLGDGLFCIYDPENPQDFLASRTAYTPPR